MSQPVFGVIGWKNSGKTTLMTRLVAEFTRRGYSVSAMKHAHHSFDIDHKGRDSYKFREAGAREVVLASPNRWAIMHELDGDDPPDFDTLLKQVAPCDLVLVEGYKRGTHPKIEARSERSLTREPLSVNDPNILAIASDGATETGGLPHFALEDIAGIADFITGTLGLSEP